MPCLLSLKIVISCHLGFSVGPILISYLVNPTAGKVLIPCSSTTWSCNYLDCNDTFDLPDASIIYREGQAPTTASTTITATASATGSTRAKATSNGSVGREVAVGAGVGVPLGLALVGALILLVRERRRKRKGGRMGMGNQTQYTVIGGHKDRPPLEVAGDGGAHEMMDHATVHELGSERGYT